MWKQDIGQWVERKGRKGWTKQQQSNHPPVSTGAAVPQLSSARVGFIPEGFENRENHSGLLSDFPIAAVGDRAAGAPSHVGQQQWVTVYGVSPTSILDVRESLDVMFGRTLMHRSPVLTSTPRDGSTASSGAGHASQQNWFYVKFEDPVAAARAVYESPLIVPVCSPNDCHRAVVGGAELAATEGRIKVVAREEAVGVAWCTDTAFLQEQLKQEQLMKSLEGECGNGGDSASAGIPGKEDEGVQNAFGATPCGVDRLQKVALSVSQENCQTRPSTAVRGLGSLIREALYSPWSARWTVGSMCNQTKLHVGASGGNADLNPGGSSSLSSISSSAHTEPFRENRYSGCNTTSFGCDNNRSNSVEGRPSLNGAAVSSNLHSQKYTYHHNAEQQVRSAQPARPLPGNSSILCAFRPDLCQRSFFKRITRGLLNIPSCAMRLLPKNGDNWCGDNTQYSDAYRSFHFLTPASQRGAQRAVLRNRHFGAASRLHCVNARGSEPLSTPVLSEWAPTRWHESSSLYSVLLVLLLLMIPYSVSYADVWPVPKHDRAGSVYATAEGITMDHEVPTRVVQPRPTGGVHDIILIDGTHDSDKYKARTL